MGLSSAIDWWDEWKLRILVLCSLLVQFFLSFAGYVRQRYVLRRLRVIVWLAYIGGDALAVYALATLFNRQKQQQTADRGGGSSALEVIWAHVLLIHLGGQQGISAYSLEDNELWKRHAITLVSQVTVALYVFCKWWSGEKRLLQAAVLLFIVGIIKFGQKPWALRRASYGNMTSTYLSSRRAEEESRSRWGINHSLEEYVDEAQKHVKEGRKKSDEAQLEKFEEEVALVEKDMYKMFLDLSAPYSVRLHYLQSFVNLDGDNQHTVLRLWIGIQFLAIYTRVRSTFTCLGFCSILVVPGLVLASVVLFAKSDKDGYHKSDITVTYILFCGTLVIKLAPFFVGFFTVFLIRCVPGCNQLLGRLTWQDMVAQHNIMSFCARKKQPPTLMKLAATFSYLRHYINKHWYIRHELAAKQISMLVRHHAEEDGWKEYINDAATYTRFNNLRGERTLMKMKPHLLLEQEKLGWTFNLPFDEYVLLWHIATDLCIHHPSSEPQDHNPIIPSSRHNSVIISNYMIYLLFICPEMLIPGTRCDLFILACDDIEHIIKNQPLPSVDERSIAQWVLRMGQDGDERLKELKMISNAYKLAKVLIIDLDNNAQMWEMIQGVWVEMLCYSASRSRGYQHAKSLAYGGEFLTNVWLLWWCMGMPTLPDMLNNPRPPEEQTSAAAASV